MTISMIWLISAGLGWAIGNSKGRPKAGFWYGLLLGWIGLIVVICMKSATVMEAAGKKYLDRPKDLPKSHLV